MSRPTVHPFGPVIAERRLNPRVAPRRSVVVSLGTPRKTKGSDDWECPFRISGAGMRRVEYGFGVDGSEAWLRTPHQPGHGATGCGPRSALGSRRGH
jgi:hypothetical protein